MDGSLLASAVCVAAVALLLPAALILLARWLGPRRPDEIKNSVFESGFEPEVDARRRISLKFHGFARLALVLQGGLALVFPLAFAYREIASPGICFALGLFFLVIAVALRFATRQGAMRWE